MSGWIGKQVFVRITGQNPETYRGYLVKEDCWSLFLEAVIDEKTKTEDLKAKIAKLGYDPTFGARSMRRVLQDKVENSLAVALLSNQVKRGQRITIDPTTFEVKKV